jgi:hypothetical protein
VTPITQLRIEIASTVQLAEHRGAELTQAISNAPPGRIGFDSGPASENGIHQDLLPGGETARLGAASKVVDAGTMPPADGRGFDLEVPACGEVE